MSHCICKKENPELYYSVGYSGHETAIQLPSVPQVQFSVFKTDYSDCVS